MTVRYDAVRGFYYRFKKQGFTGYGQGFASKAEAAMAEVKDLASQSSGKTKPSRELQTLKFGEAAQFFIDEYVPDLSHRNDYYQRLPLICAKLKGRGFLSVTTGELRTALRSIKEERGWSDQTYNHAIAHIRRLYQWWQDTKKFDLLGEDSGFVVPNPAARLEFFKVASNEVKAIPEAMRPKLSAAVKADGRIWGHYRVALHMGLREANICHARVKDVNWQDWTLSVVAKGRKRGDLPIPLELRSDFLKWAANKAPEDFLLGLHKNTVSRIFTEIAKSVGLEEATFHWLRHTCAHYLLTSKKFSLYAVSKLLLHSTYRVTEKVYGKWAAKDLEEAVEATSEITALPARVLEAV